MITLYWVTGTIGQSFRQYVDFAHNRPRPEITVPVAVTLSTEPVMANYPRELAERACTDLRHWSEPGRGGHFMPLEEPGLLAGELRQFFRDW